MLYPLTRIWPVYLSSRGGVLFVGEEGEELYLEEPIEVDAVGVTGDRPKRVKYDWGERAGSIRARAAW
jgi:hypothetical protein